MIRSLSALVDSFRDARVVVLGDMVADIYIAGTPMRISREAPVLIIRHDSERLVPGSAANAAANLLSLGAKILPVGVVGDDAHGRELEEYFTARGVDTSGLIKVRGRATTTKTRILAGDINTSKQQVVRLDRDGGPLTGSVRSKLAEALKNHGARADAILASDYGYGVIHGKVMKTLHDFASTGKAVIGDSRFALGTLKGLALVTPNEEEASVLAKHPLNTEEILTEKGEDLRKKYDWEALIITRGNRGMALFERGRDPVFIPVSGSTDIVDVSGAGDTVAAASTLSIVTGGSFLDAARIANIAAGVVVMKRGTATINTTELLASLMVAPDE